jgi:anti-sigma-K factor RskA
MEREPKHNTVGVYERPPAWRSRKVLVPVAIFVVVVIAYALYFLL